MCLGSVVRYNSNTIGSDHSNVSDDLAECENLNEYIKIILNERWLM